MASGPASPVSLPMQTDLGGCCSRLKKLLLGGETANRGCGAGTKQVERPYAAGVSHQTAGDRSNVSIKSILQREGQYELGPRLFAQNLQVSSELLRKRVHKAHTQAFRFLLELRRQPNALISH